MDPIKISEQTRRQLEALPPEKRAEVEEILRRIHSPEYRAREIADRMALDKEYRETGRIRTVGEFLPKDQQESMQAFLATLRARREAAGLSLNDVAERSGLDKGQLSRLENGRHPNPTLFTLGRYAAALGLRLGLTIENA
jgi:hypothetical protein